MSKESVNEPKQPNYPHHPANSKGRDEETHSRSGLRGIHTKRLLSATSDIAKAINVSHGTIFVHFPTRDDLLIYILEEFGSNTAKRIHKLASGNSDVDGVLRAHLNSIKENEQFYTRLISESRLLPLKVRNTQVMMQSTIAVHLGAAIEKGIANGDIRDLPLYFIFNSWMGLMHYYLQNNDLFAPNSSVIERYGYELINNFLLLIGVC